MLSSPGFSIPSIGTPLHQPEEDQQILPHNSPIPTPRQQQQNGFGLALPHQQINNSSSSQNLYSLPGFTPQHMLQPQTPVIFQKYSKAEILCCNLLHEPLYIHKNK